MADTIFIIIMQATLQFTHFFFSDVHWDIVRLLQEYYDVHQMKYNYTVTTTYTGVKPAITNKNVKPALNG